MVGLHLACDGGGLGSRHRGRPGADTGKYVYRAEGAAELVITSGIPPSG